MDLDPIRDRLEAATDGPWAWCNDSYGSVLRSAGLSPVCIYDTRQGLSQRPIVPDCDLIAHSPTDIAALLEELERVQGFYEQASTDAAKYQTAYTRTANELKELRTRYEQSLADNEHLVEAAQRAEDKLDELREFS